MQEVNLDLKIAHFIRDIGFSGIVFYISFFKYNIAFFHILLLLFVCIVMLIGMKIFKITQFLQGFINYAIKTLVITSLLYVILITTINVSK